jgi:hypothetical protein
MENEGTKRMVGNMMKDQLRHKCSNEDCPQSKIDSSVTSFRFVKKFCDVCLLCGKSAVYECLGKKENSIVAHTLQEIFMEIM